MEMPPVPSFLVGMIIGFSLAAPIGPVGILCIRRALADGRTAAFVAGLGAALADAAFGSVVALGLGAVTGFLDDHADMIRATGGLFMGWLGVHAWRTAAVTIEAVPGKGPGLWRDFAATFVVTITNPGTILGIIGIAAAFGPAVRTADAGGAAVLVAGIFAGSGLWWLVLSAAASAARARLTPERLRLFNHGSGALLLAFGAAALASLLF